MQESDTVATMKRLKKMVVDWYHGPWVGHENDPRSDLIFMTGGHKPHWTARIAQCVVGFWVSHWQWTIGTVIALVGLAFAYKRLG